MREFYPPARSQQAGARVLFKDFGIPHIAMQRFFRSMA
jgi:hypothetical protein